MLFTIEEIKNYLLTKKSLEEAIQEMNNESIVNCNQYPESFLFERNDDSLKKYEIQIGLFKLKEEQRRLNAKQWLALSPKWIDKETKIKAKTKYEIKYWVNYGDGDTYGWFTVEQIIEWLKTPNLKLHTLGGTKEGK